MPLDRVFSCERTRKIICKVLSCVFTGGSLFQKRDEHRHSTSIIIVVLAEELSEVVFLELYADQDVGRGCDGEKQMARRHVWGRPECDDESRHNRVADISVEAAGLECYVMVLLVSQMEPDLPESEQVEVIDHERGEQHGGPSDPEKSEQYYFAKGILHAPYYARHGMPLPIEEQQEEAGGEDEGAPLHLHRHKFRPPPLKNRTGHDGMLHCKQSQQAQVYNETWQKAGFETRADRLGYDEIAYESYRVKK